MPFLVHLTVDIRASSVACVDTGGSKVKACTRDLRFEPLFKLKCDEADFEVTDSPPVKGHILSLREPWWRY